MQYGPCMASYVCRFPDGLAGVGLVVLRSSGAFVLVGEGLAVQVGWAGIAATHWAVGMLSFALVVGLAARAVSVLISMGMLVVLLASAHPLILAAHLGTYLAIVLMGPGAYSLDARLHGRRVIHLLTRQLDRGDDP